jgi:phosphoribosylpyrophosphate synthetase
MDNSIRLYATSAAFHLSEKIAQEPGVSLNRIHSETIQNSSLEKLFISDTVIETIDHPKIEILSCATLLAKAIENLNNNQSLSSVG